MSVQQLRELVDKAKQFQPVPVDPLPFAVVSVLDLEHTRPTPPAFWWDGYIPAGVVSLLGAHGGIGKTTLGLMLGVCVVAGLPLFGVSTRRGVVAFFSAEDSGARLRYLLRKICDLLGVNVRDLDGRLHILDATEGDPALFHEIATGGRRIGCTTPTYEALKSYVETHSIDVLIIDNASDTFDASEIDRARVRGFMRSLAAIAKARDGAVLLLAHVDKGVSRGEARHTEGYSGSTAWHNSARSRLYLNREKDGSLTLEQQKNNLGKLRDPISLQWPEGGLPIVPYVPTGIVGAIAERNDLKALLKLLHEYHSRGEFVAPDIRSRYHAVKVLGSESTFPRLKPAEVFGLLRDAERRKLIEREAYKDANRKAHERWKLTAAGCELIGIAPSAPSAPSTEDGTPGHPAQQGARQVRHVALGGMGDVERAEVGADGGEE